MTGQEIRDLALLWVEGEITRLMLMRDAIQRPRAAKMTPARAAIVRQKILSGRQKNPSTIPHWTQLPENRTKMLRNVRRASKIRLGRAA
jgi:hypothetical protein